jgi:hypothetical protein
MGSYTLWHGPKADLHKSGLRAFQGGPNKQNLPLFLCLLIRNLMAFWTNIVLLKPNLKSKFIKFFFCEKQGFSGPPPQKARSPDLCLPTCGGVYKGAASWSRGAQKNLEIGNFYFKKF